MSETFTKLFSSITDSTIWSQDNETRLVWITMLAMADKDGYVGASVDGLARRANVSLEATERALAAFLAPDKRSRSQDQEGRRIAVVERGWTLINYRRFRELRDEDVRREGNRLNKRAQRDKERQTRLGHVSNVSPGQPPSAPVSPSRSDQKQIKIRSDQNGSECAETADRSTPFLTFPCDGEPSTWVLTEAQIGRWCELFPSLAVSDECRKALAWIEASPSRRKTAGGMERFLVNWFGRAQNRGGGNDTSKPRDVTRGWASAMTGHPKGEQKL